MFYEGEIVFNWIKIEKDEATKLIPAKLVVVVGGGGELINYDSGFNKGIQITEDCIN